MLPICYCVLWILGARDGEDWEDGNGIYKQGEGYRDHRGRSLATASGMPLVPSDYKLVGMRWYEEQETLRSQKAGDVE